MIAFYKQMLRSQRWEDRFGAINGILAMIQTRQDSNGARADLDTFLWEYILEVSFPELIIDEEFRVRN